MTETEMLRNAGSIESFTRGQPVFSQYDSGDEMYVVLKGTFGVYINTFTGFTSRVAGISQGSFFGEMAVIDGSPRSATIVSEDEGAVVVKIGRDNFKLLLENAPNMTSAIMKTLHTRAVTTSESVSKAGKTSPVLPPVLTGEDTKNSGNIMHYLTMLADNIRNMNDALFIEGGISDDLDEIAELVAAEELKETEELQKSNIDFVPDCTSGLLPKGYKPFKITDTSNNTDIMREMRVVCPYCFKTLIADVPKHGELGNKTEQLDGRIIYSNLNILLYTNTVCPNCNYCDTNMEFSIPRKVSDPPKYKDNQFKNIEDFTGFVRAANRTMDEVILSYYLNIYCLMRVTHNPLRYANAWIRLYWLYSDQGSTEFATQSAQKALRYYRKYYENNSSKMSVDDLIRLKAILGELSVVTGDSEGALDYYAKIIDTDKSKKNDSLQKYMLRYKELQDN